MNKRTSLYVILMIIIAIGIYGFLYDISSPIKKGDRYIDGEIIRHDDPHYDQKVIEAQERKEQKYLQNAKDRNDPHKRKQRQIERKNVIELTNRN